MYWDTKNFLRIYTILWFWLVAVDKGYNKKCRHDDGKNKDGYRDGPSAPSGTPHIHLHVGSLSPFAPKGFPYFLLI